MTSTGVPGSATFPARSTATAVNEWRPSLSWAELNVPVNPGEESDVSTVVPSKIRTSPTPELSPAPGSVGAVTPIDTTPDRTAPCVMPVISTVAGGWVSTQISPDPVPRFPALSATWAVAVYLPSAKAVMGV